VKGLSGCYHRLLYCLFSRPHGCKENMPTVNRDLYACTRIHTHILSHAFIFLHCLHASYSTFFAHDQQIGRIE
jgi:hypothetical protein